VEINGLSGSFYVGEETHHEGLPILPFAVSIIVIVAVIGGVLYWKV